MLAVGDANCMRLYLAPASLITDAVLSIAALGVAFARTAPAITIFDAAPTPLLVVAINFIVFTIPVLALSFIFAVLVAQLLKLFAVQFIILAL